MGPFAIALILFAPSVALADGPIYRCSHGVYSDNCDRAKPVITVSLYTLEQWETRTRGLPCPSSQIVRLVTGDLVCQVYQAQIFGVSSDDARLIREAE